MIVPATPDLRNDSTELKILICIGYPIGLGVLLEAVHRKR